MSKEDAALGSWIDHRNKVLSRITKLQMYPLASGRAFSSSCDQYRPLVSPEIGALPSHCWRPPLLCRQLRNYRSFCLHLAAGRCSQRGFGLSSVLFRFCGHLSVTFLIFLHPALAGSQSAAAAAWQYPACDLAGIGYRHGRIRMKLKSRPA